MYEGRGVEGKLQCTREGGKLQCTREGGWRVSYSVQGKGGGG